MKKRDSCRLAIGMALSFVAACSNSSGAPGALSPSNGAPSPSVGTLSPSINVPSFSIKGYPKGALGVSTEDGIATFRVEIADTPERRTLGLMQIERLPKGSGMVFLFDSETDTPFHMKDTLVPLDIAFWSSDGTIVEILQMEPCRVESCPSYRSSVPFVGAVEVNRGELALAGIGEGDTVRLKRRDPQGS